MRGRGLVVAGAAALVVAGGAAVAAEPEAGGSGQGAAGHQARGEGDGHGHGHGHGQGHGQRAGLTVVLRDSSDERVGVVRLRQVGDVVLVRGAFWSLTPGFHGFHVHGTGVCDPAAPAGPFTTAGGHYAGGESAHGDHAGDLPSLLVTGEGRAAVGFVTDRFSVSELRDADGSAVMVHQGRDNFANIPERYAALGTPGPDAATLATGDAGTRAACGVVRPASP